MNRIVSGSRRHQRRRAAGRALVVLGAAQRDRERPAALPAGTDAAPGASPVQISLLCRALTWRPGCTAAAQGPLAAPVMAEPRKETLQGDSKPGRGVFSTNTHLFFQLRRHRSSAPARRPKTLTAAARALMQRGFVSGTDVPAGWPSPNAGGTVVASTRPRQLGPAPVETKRAELVRSGTFSLYRGGNPSNSSGYLRCA